MKFNALILIVCLMACSFNAVALQQTPPKPEQKVEPSVVLSAREVVLDVVVRDKKGRPVKNLAASDFEVYEDGVRQQIESFRLVSREPAAEPSPKESPAPPAAPPPPSPPRSLSELNFIALVFDRLSPNARARAHKAALSYVSETPFSDDRVGVFVIDLSLRVIQFYTGDQQLVRQAIDRALALSTSNFASSAEQVRNLSERSSALGEQTAAAAQAAAQAGANQDAGGVAEATGQLSAAAAERALTEMRTRMLETVEALERDQQGYATTNGLMAVVSALSRLTGRKTVIFFSEGLAIPPNVQRFFRSVINAANRANVSIYPIDAAGLRLDSPMAETTREINSLGRRRSAQAASGLESTQGPMTRELERNEDLLRLNPHSGLGQLADETGGFLIRETNDLSAGLRRIDEDAHLHYVLSYVPKNTDYDGRFRQISVKVGRSNVEVQTRKGYLAISTSFSVPVLDYEAPALAALTSGRVAGSVPLRAAGLSFPEATRPGLAPVLVEVPASAFTHAIDKSKKVFNTDFSIVVLIKDQSQQVVRKLSQHYLVTGPADKVDAARASDILFYRETQLPPGRYSIEAVAHDAPSGKASLTTTHVDVPDANGSQLRMSSLTLLKRAEKLSAADQQAANPFHFGDVLIYPNLGEPVRKSASRQLAFFFTAYAAKGSSDKPTFILEVISGGGTIGRTSGELPAPDAGGRIQYATALPLDGFPPGAYELKVTVKDARTSVSRSARFTVEP
jgi:VWFA-related protein